MTSFVFTNNESAVVYFNGIVKIKCDDIVPGAQVVILEERVDGVYEFPGDSWAVIQYPEKSRLVELMGNYKIKRTNSSIAVGYEI